MSINKKSIFFTCLISMITTYSWADCTRSSAPTYIQDTDLGRVVVSPDLPVNSVIAYKTWTMATGKIYYRCPAGTYIFEAKITNPNSKDIGEKIYSTNIEGIGIRFKRGGGAIEITYPDNYKLNLNEERDLYLDGSTFTMEIIKTKNVTGSGTLSAGKYTSYDLITGNNPILETIIHANAITIVSPSCTILSGKNMNVDVGNIKLNDLSKIGTTAGSKNFDIKLKCNGGVTESGYANIQTSFSRTPVTDTALNNGVLLNEKSGTSMAKGVGIQVFMKDYPIEFGKDYSIKTVNSNEEKYIEIPLEARFYQYESTISAGEVESHMTFNITYN